MSKLQIKRLILTLSIIVSISIGIGILLFTLKQNINLFYTPSEVLKDFDVKSVMSKNIRLGGIVVKGSVKTEQQATLNHEFSITDNEYDIKVLYTGILPDLFKEDKAIVAEGSMQNNKTFLAHTLLAKHDENYKPPKLKNI